MFHDRFNDIMKLFIHYIMLKLSNQYITNINIRLYIKEYDNVIKFLRLKTILYEQQRERAFLSDVIELLLYY